MSTFRLGLVNPNTSITDTSAMAELARAALPDDAVVCELTAGEGYAAIEGDVGHVAAAAQVVGLLRAHPDLDAYLIGCFDDPALHAARELTSAPVVGIGEAACISACLVARRFAVITTLRRGVPAIADGLRAKGLHNRCAGILALERGVREQEDEAAEDVIVVSGRRAVDELGADALVLACGAMAARASAVAARLSVPVCDGVGFGALTAQALWRTGLGTSSRGAYAWPLELADDRSS